MALKSHSLSTSSHHHHPNTQCWAKFIFCAAIVALLLSLLIHHNSLKPCRKLSHQQTAGQPNKQALCRKTNTPYSDRNTKRKTDILSSKRKDHWRSCCFSAQGIWHAECIAAPLCCVRAGQPMVVVVSAAFGGSPDIECLRSTRFDNGSSNNCASRIFHILSP